MTEAVSPSVEWGVQNPAALIFAALVLSLGIRFVHSLLRAVRLTHESPGRYWRHVRDGFLGFHPDPKNADYWYTYLIGAFELVGYAIFIATNTLTPIGAWIGLKTVAQWNLWQEDRARFNLFLIGNLLVIAAAWLVLAPMVSVSE
jgi:hypothetical protein